MDNLIDPDTSTRLGCRGDEATNIADIEGEAWLDGFNWSALEDGSMPSPFATACKDHAAKSFTGPPSKFEPVPEFKGDNKWCLDWDFTCTIGYDVEDSKATNGAKAPAAGSALKAAQELKKK